MSTKDLALIFAQLGLKEEHARVYLACLEAGPAAVRLIAKKAKVPRSSCYALLGDLMQLGLVSYVETESRRVYASESPALIQEILQRRESDLQMSLTQLAALSPTLAAMHQSQNPDLPKVRFFQGPEGLQALYYDTLAYFEHLVVCQGSLAVKISQKNPLPAYLVEYAKEVLKRMIRSRELLEDSPFNQEYLKLFTSDRNQFFLIQPGREVSAGHVDKIIYGSKIAYVSHDNLIGIIIEEDSLSGQERAVFEILWEHFRIQAGRERRGNSAGASGA